MDEQRVREIVRQELAHLNSDGSDLAAVAMRICVAAQPLSEINRKRLADWAADVFSKAPRLPSGQSPLMRFGHALRKWLSPRWRRH